MTPREVERQAADAERDGGEAEEQDADWLADDQSKQDADCLLYT